MQEDASDRTLLQMKLQDVSVLYHGFRDYLKDHYMTAEEVLEILARQIVFSEKLKDSVLLLDGFTGFTPIQIQVIRELLTSCEKVSVTVTMDVRESFLYKEKSHQLFYMSHKMIRSLCDLTKDILEPIWIAPGSKSRHARAEALAFLEQNLFRYQKKTFSGKQDSIRIFCAGDPVREMEETARRILRLVREEGCRYGEIAVITGDLETYGSLARQAFEDAGIPFFVDEKHSILMNPFVEYIRAALEMAAQGFSYESVFRYLRCGMSDVTREETDWLENYAVALGIRGFKRWKEKWIRVYRGMKEESLLEINRIREKFTEETEALALGFSGKKKTVREYCQYLYEFIVKSRIQEKLKIRRRYLREKASGRWKRSTPRFMGLLWNCWIKWQRSWVRKSYLRKNSGRFFETGMSQAKVALIPPGVDQVLVGDIGENPTERYPGIVFCGNE